jgi:hypothetical protein
MLTAAVLSALMLQQAATGQVVWATPVEPAPVVAEAEAPAIPDWARTDPFGYERSECSPLVRSASESMEACQGRVRFALAANLGDALPASLQPVASLDNCRQEASGDRYGVQCGAPSRTVPGGPDLRDKVCTTRPSGNREGGMTYREDCTVGGEPVREEGLRIRLSGND